MGDEERVNGRLLEAESFEAIGKSPPTLVPVRAAVDQEQAAIGFDGVGIDPCRRLEGQGNRDQVDPVSQRPGWRNGLHDAVASRALPGP